MKKIVIIAILLLLLPLCMAEQTVKTIEIPLGFDALALINETVLYNFSLTPPDGIYDVVSIEFIVKADLIANTKVKGGVIAYNTTIFCTPTEWSAPTWNVDGYEMSFDCTSKIPDNFDWEEIATQPLEFALQFNNYAGSVKPRLRMTYYNNPFGDITVVGTYYEVGDEGKVIAQLSELGVPINNATCYASIYYPDNSLYVRNSHMRYIDSSDGLYVYNTMIPETVGVYPVSVTCSYVTYEEDYFIENININNGTFISGQISDTYYDDDNNVVLQSVSLSTNISMLDVDIIFNTTVDYINESTLLVDWTGECEKEGALGYFWWYNLNTDTWDVSENTIYHGLTQQSFESPNEIYNYINESGEILTKFNGTAVKEQLIGTVASDNFEDGTLSPFIETCFTSQCDIAVSASSPLNGTYSLRMRGDGDVGDDELGQATLNINASGRYNLTLAYTRQVVGAESNNCYTVNISSDNGTTWQQLESFCGNSGTTRMEYNLSSSYDNQPNIILKIYMDVNHDSDEFRFDDFILTYKDVAGCQFVIDMFRLQIIDIASVVTEIRGGGEFNVKDRIAGIEESLEDIENEIINGVEKFEYLNSPNFPFNETGIISHRLSYSVGSVDFIEAGADCLINIWGSATNLTIGEQVVYEEAMTELGSGMYYYPFITNLTGIFTVEINCNNSNRYYYGATQYRVETPVENVTVSGTVNALVQNLDDIADTIDELYKVEVFGTDYNPQDNGRIFVAVTQGDTYVNDANCYLDVDYPSSTSDNSSLFIENAYMLPMGYNGLYYYDFLVPDEIGIYMVTATCDIGINNTFVFGSYDSLNEGVVISGSIANTYADDGSFYKIEETKSGAVYLYQQDFYFDFSSINEYNNTNNSLLVNFIGGNPPDNGEEMIFQIYNWTSAAYQDLPNQLVSQDVEEDITVGQNLPSHPDYFNASGYIIIRITDTERAVDTSKNDIRIDKFEAGISASIQAAVDIKTGGGELNVRDDEKEHTFIGSAEYLPGTDGKIAIRLTRGSGLNSIVETGAVCNVTILYPNETLLINNTAMTEFGTAGIYYYDFTVPSTLGIYTFYTDCVTDTRAYYALNTFHVTQINATTDLSGVLTQLDTLETYLLSIITEQEHQGQFSEEQIYLITDSITALTTIKEKLKSGTITPEQAAAELNKIEQTTLNNKAFYAPNELHILVNEESSIYIKNEGKIDGYYELIITIKDNAGKEVRSTRTHLILAAGSERYISIDFSGLPKGAYTVNVVSKYADRESKAEARILYDPDTGKTSLEEVLTGRTDQAIEEYSTSEKARPFLIIAVAILLFLMFTGKMQANMEKYKNEIYRSRYKQEVKNEME